MKCTLREDQYTFSVISPSLHVTMRNVSDKLCRENQNTHFTFSFIFKTCRLSDNVKKYRVGQAASDNMVHVHFMLDA
jgi:hypothetical protein